MEDPRVIQLTEILGVPDKVETSRHETTLKWNSQPGTMNWITCHILKEEIQVITLWCSTADYCHPFRDRDDAFAVASKIAALRSL